MQPSIVSTNSASNPQSAPQLVALFPGQGSQVVGMAKDLYENYALVRELFEEASDAIHLSLKKLCFEGPDSELLLTQNTQPALLTASLAAYRAFEVEAKNRGVTLSFTAAAGHSLGEYSALVAAGAIDFGTAVRWVRARGEAMQAAVPVGTGGMAAILGLEDTAIAALCQDAAAQSGSVCEAANFNAPGQVVIAGTTSGINAALALLQTAPDSTPYKGAKAIPLPVSAPFHCSLMKPARERMAELFLQSGVQPRSLQMAYYPNRTARPTREPTVVLELLIEQIDHAVLWCQTVSQMLERGMTHAIEFGPGKVLAGLTKRIEKQSSRKMTVLNAGDCPSVLATLDAWAKIQAQSANTTPEQKERITP